LFATFTTAVHVDFQECPSESYSLSASPDTQTFI